GRGKVVERITAGVVVHCVVAVEPVHTGECLRVDGPLISRREVQREHLLALVLARLVVGVWNLQPVAGGERVHVEGVAAAGMDVEKTLFRWSETGCPSIT